MQNVASLKVIHNAAGGACRVCVVYGALPPEMRRTQARLFNDPDSGYDVLVASDAVGMGLNLNIRRIIFHTLEKTDGSFARVPISVSQIKQIAGARSHGFLSHSWHHLLPMWLCLHLTDANGWPGYMRSYVKV